MNARELGQLLMKQPTAEIFGQLAALAAAASKDGKAHLLKRMLVEHGVGNVHSPVNGFVLYVLCTNLKGAPSLKLLDSSSMPSTPGGTYNSKRSTFPAPTIHAFAISQMLPAESFSSS